MASNPTLSQIKVGNVVYDICDTSARNNISSLGSKRPSKWFQTRTASFSTATITSNGTGTLTATPSTINNYTPISSTGYRIYTTNGNVYRYETQTVSSTASEYPEKIANVTIGVRNNESKAQTVTGYATFLYAANSTLL